MTRKDLLIIRQRDIQKEIFLPIESWMYLDMLLSKIPILRRKGHFAIFVAKKLS